MMTLVRQRPPLSMHCARASERAQAAHDGELARAEAAALFAHAESCPRCRGTMRLESRFIDMARARLLGAARTGAPASVHARIRARLRSGARARIDVRA